MIIDIGPILYSILVLYAVAGILLLTLVCTGIWAAKRILSNAKSVEEQTKKEPRTPTLPYHPVTHAQNR